MSKFKYSVFSVMVPELKFEEIAELVAKTGFEGIEWRIGVAHLRRPNDSPSVLAKGVTGDFTYWDKVKEEVSIEALVKNAPRLKKLAEANHLKIPAMTTYLKMAQTPNLLKQIEEVFKGAQIMGCSQFRVQVPNYDRSQNYNELFEATLTELEKVQRLSQKYEVKANIEIHANCITPSAGLAYRIVQNFDPKHIGVILDPGNMTREGMENWKMGMELLGKYLAHVHVKNCGWFLKEKHPEGAVWESPWVGLREGMINWGQVLADLKQVGYEGWLSLEDFSLGSTEEKLRDDLKYLKQLEAQASS